MRTRSPHALPARLESVRRRFDRWRQTRTGCSRIPAGLWALAVRAAGRYGLNPTARALGLDYNALKRHVEAADREPPDRATGAGNGSDRPSITTFLELPSPASGGAAECILELEHPRGAKMRVHLKGVAAPDLAALSRSFWSGEA